MRTGETLNTVVAIIGLLLSSCLVDAVRSNNSAANDKCFADYLEARTNIMNQYQSSYIECNKEGNVIHRRPLAATDIEGEKTNLAEASDEICFSLNACHQIGDIKSYLECYSKTASDNFFKSLGIHVNASAIVIELSEDYEEAEKQVMLCNLQANREFVTNSFDAYEQFLDCLEER